MSIKITVSFVAGCIAGFALHATMMPKEQDQLTLQQQTKIDALEKQVASLEKLDKVLKEKIKQLDGDSESSISDAESEGGESFDQANIQVSEENQTLSDANFALSAGDVSKAMSLFNIALNDAKSEEEREAAIDGLIGVYRANHDYIMRDGVHLHGALWQLFEIHKLKPSDALKNEMMNLSNEAYLRAQNYTSEENLLGSVDYLGSLMHISNMVGFKLSDSEGNELGPAELKEQLDTVQYKPEFIGELKSRATRNLQYGTEFEKTIVFWDYTKLAEVSGKDIWKDETFTSQFTDSALLHLNHLKSMNQTGEIKSRLDYIRYAFPALMKDERLYRFH